MRNLTSLKDHELLQRTEIRSVAIIGLKVQQDFRMALVLA